MRRICICIPVHNEAKYIEFCLNSIKNNTVLPDEIIFIDDGSTDNSLQIAKNILKNIHCETHVIKNNINIGLIKCMNLGIEKSNSDYILFLSGNDFLKNNIIESYQNELSVNDYGLISALSNVIDSDNRLENISKITYTKENISVITPCEFIKINYKYGNYFSGPTILFNRKILIQLGCFEELYGGLVDYQTAILTCLSCNSLFFPEVFAVRRIHGNGFLYNTIKSLPNTLCSLDQFNKNLSYLNYPKNIILKFFNRHKKRVLFWAFLNSNFKYYDKTLIDIKFIDNKFVRLIINKNYYFKILILFIYFRYYDIFNLIKSYIIFLIRRFIK